MLTSPNTGKLVRARNRRLPCVWPDGPITATVRPAPIRKSTCQQALQLSRAHAIASRVGCASLPHDRLDSWYMHRQTSYKEIVRIPSCSFL
eukprot:4126848-Amphidinium_carterae.1